MDVTPVEPEPEDFGSPELMPSEESPEDFESPESPPREDNFIMMTEEERRAEAEAFLAIIKVYDERAANEVEHQQETEE